MTGIPRDRGSISNDALAVLKQLALKGGLSNTVPVVREEFSTRLKVSFRLLERQLSELEGMGHIERQSANGGQQITITDRGVDALRREYQEYCSVFEAERPLPLTGSLVDGAGEGKKFISLDGYQRQFRERLGYEPFPGTLNIELDEESIRQRELMETLDGIPIDEWEDDGQTYGSAVCYGVDVCKNTSTYSSVHVLVPDRTHHGSSIVEVIAPEKLRDTLSIEPQDDVRLYITE